MRIQFKRGSATYAVGVLLYTSATIFCLELAPELEVLIVFTQILTLPAVACIYFCTGSRRRRRPRLDAILAALGLLYGNYLIILGVYFSLVGSDDIHQQVAGVVILAVLLLAFIAFGWGAFLLSPPIKRPFARPRYQRRPRPRNQHQRQRDPD